MSEVAGTPSTDRCPIAFDQHSPEHGRNWPEEFREMRQQCPRVRSDKYSGFWVATKYTDIVNIGQKANVFGSDKKFDPETGEVEGGIGIPPFPVIASKPSEADSPEWDKLRIFLNGRFSPKAVERYQSLARNFAAALIDQIIETGRFDIVRDLTNPLPALVTMALFGLPLDEWKTYANAVHKQVFVSQESPEFQEVISGFEYFNQRIEEEVKKRRENPTDDDLLGYFAAGKIDGEPVDIELIKNMSFNILLGGVGTTTGLTANALYYLSHNPQQRQRLIDEPELLPRACEEFLRFVSPLHVAARTAKQDFEMDGWQFEKGDRVLMAYASGNRDPEIFEDPEQVKLDRAPNRHIAFGAGQHRCLGSFLARIMFGAMMSEVLTRLPDYKVIEEEGKPFPSIGYINGWITMPATFTPGKKVGAVLP